MRGCGTQSWEMVREVREVRQGGALFNTNALVERAMGSERCVIRLCARNRELEVCGRPSFYAMQQQGFVIGYPAATSHQHAPSPAGSRPDAHLGVNLVQDLHMRMPSPI